jgi:hypothetical protein
VSASSSASHRTGLSPSNAIILHGAAENNRSVLPPFAAPPCTRSISRDLDMGMVRLNHTFGGPVVGEVLIRHIDKAKGRPARRVTKVCRSLE